MIDSGTFILNLIIDDDILDIVFDNQYFARLNRHQRILTKKLVIFISLCFITFYEQSLSYNEIQQSILDWYNSLDIEKL